VTDTLMPLPSRTPPLDGETFPSYLDRICASLALPISLTTLLYRLGLQDTDLATDTLSSTGLMLSREHLENAAYVLRLKEERLRPMLLSAYDGTVLDLTDLDPENPQSIRRVGLREWAYLVGSHFCPDCLKEDQAWRLAWKVPFSFACARHGVLLNDTCPRCARRSGNIREDLGGVPSYVAQKRRPGFCMNPPATGVADVGRSSQPCGQDLGAVPRLDLRDAPRLLGTQRHLNGIMESGVDSNSGLLALEYFQALRSLCALMLYVAEPGDLGELPPPVLKVFADHAEERNRRIELRRDERAAGEVRRGPTVHVYGAAPTSAALMASLLPRAVEILTPARAGELDPAELSGHLQPFIHRLRDREQGRLRLVSQNFHFTGALARGFNRTLDDQGGFNHRLGMQSRHAKAERYDFTDQHVPQLLWENEYRRHFEPLFGDTDMAEPTLRRVCSAALVRLSLKSDWLGACNALGFPVTFAKGGCNKAMGVINGLQNTTAFAEALHDLAGRLGALPGRANFHARRFALLDFLELSPGEWDEIALEHLRKPGKNWGKRRHAAVFIWEKVTGGDWRLAPALRGMAPGPARDMYVRFLKQDEGMLGPSLMIRARRMATELDTGYPELMLELPE